MAQHHHSIGLVSGLSQSRNQNKYSAIILLILLSGLLYVFTAKAGTPFTISGDVTINPIGGASYNIPIDVPVGTSGMEPKVSITYTGGAGNGMMGLGFGLTGLPQISRCSKAKHLDGVGGVIDFTKNDRFCLDGQRLFATSDVVQADGTHKTTSAYGQNLTEYRTEQANFSKIISYGQTDNADGTTAPHYFKVWTKSGQIFRFGFTPDSRANIQVNGYLPTRLHNKDLVRVWAVDQISDTVGNYINVEYTDDASFGNAGLEGLNSEVYISRINYTGNTRAGTNPYASVRFEYEGRPDTKDKDYLAGSEVKKTKRLQSIKTYFTENGQDQLVKQYKLTYLAAGAYSHADNYDKNGSLLSKVEECDGSNNCLEPTEFGWQVGEEYHLGGDGDLTMFHNPQVNKLPTTTAFDVIAVGDVNGDGLKDIIYLDALGDDGNGNQAAWYLLGINTGNGFVQQGAALDWVGRSCARYGEGALASQCLYYSYWDVMPYLADVNDDGKADLIYGHALESPANILVRLSTGSGFGPEQTWMSGKRLVAVGDYDGDYQADVVFQDTATETTRTLGLAKSNGSQFVNQNINLGTQQNVCIGTTTAMGQTICNEYRGPGERVFLADVNGDGRADLIKGGLIRKSIVSDTGTVSFDVEENWFQTTSSGGYSIFGVADYNGDGKSDILYYRLNNGGSYHFATSSNESFEDIKDMPVGVPEYQCQTTMGSCDGGYQDYNTGPFIHDFNYDGQADVLGGNLYREGIYLRPDHLQTIRQGFDHQITLYYGKLSGSLGSFQTYFTDQGVAGVDAAYPDMDILQNSSQEVVTAIARSSGLEDGNGIKNHVTTYYQYGGGKTNVKGQGFLGFRWQKETHSEHKKNTTTYYIQHPPYVGIPFQTETRLDNGTLIGRTDKTYTEASLPVGSSATKYPHLKKLTEYGFKTDGSLLTRTETTNTYDDFGNVTQIEVQTGNYASGDLSNPSGITVSDLHTKTTTNTFYNNPSQYNTLGSSAWILGRLIRSTVTTTNDTVLPTVAAIPSQDHSPDTPAVDILQPAEQSNESPSVTVSVSNVSPTEGDSILLTASATDADGSIQKVEFMVNGVLVGFDTTPETGTNDYRVAWTVTSGNSVVTAKAIDNNNAETVSSGVGLTVSAANTGNAAPTVTASASNLNPAVGEVITLTATAADNDGTVAKVEFLVDNNVVNTDTAAPYSFDWTATAGTHTIVGRATDDANAVTSSNSVTVNAGSNNNATVVYTEDFSDTTQTVSLTGTQNNGIALIDEGTANGHILFNNSPQSSNNWPNFSTNESFNYVVGQIVRGEVTTSTLPGLDVKFYIKGNHSDNTSYQLRANFGQGGFSYHFVDNGNWNYGGGTGTAIKANTTYVVEYELTDDGPDMYVYEKGQTRAESVLTKTVTNGAWVAFTIHGEGYQSSSITGTTNTKFDNLYVGGADGAGSINGSNPSNTPPTVSVTASNTSPTVDDVVTLTATAADSDGSISQVEFLVDNTVVNTDSAAPYSYDWTATSGTHTIIARATDNENAITDSSGVTVTVAGNTNGTVELLSQGKPATQSSTLDLSGSGVPTGAGLAVDGDYTSNFQWSASNTLTHTASDTESEAWWQVDLGQTASIERVKVWNRSDCCSDRLKYFYIFVSDNDMTGKTVQQLLSDNTVSAKHVDESLNNVASKEYLLDNNPQGRYVKIQLTGTGYLTLAEVEVHGIAGGTGNQNTGGGETTPPANEPPTVAIETPAEGASSVEGNPITITAVAGDNDGTVASVSFYNGSQLLGSDTAAPYSYTWNNPSVGTHGLTAVATDDAGATTTSVVRTVSVTADTSSSNGSTIYAEDFSGSTHSLNLWGGVQVTGLGTSSGKLLLENFNQANQNWPGYRSAQTFDYVVGQIFRTEVTTGSLSGLDSKVFIEGQKPDGTSVQLRANFHQNGFSSHYVDNGWHWDVGSAVNANTTYIVEIEMKANGPTLYVHEQGAARGSSMIREVMGGVWANFQLRGESYQGPSVSGTTQVSVDNLTVSQP